MDTVEAPPVTLAVTLKHSIEGVSADTAEGLLGMLVTALGKFVEAADVVIAKLPIVFVLVEPIVEYVPTFEDVGACKNQISGPVGDLEWLTLLSELLIPPCRINDGKMLVDERRL